MFFQATCGTDHVTSEQLPVWGGVGGLEGLGDAEEGVHTQAPAPPFLGPPQPQCELIVMHGSHGHDGHSFTELLLKGAPGGPIIQ